jgi:hypothetical protein
MPTSRRRYADASILLDLLIVTRHMVLADVIQLDHCFPIRLQSIDLALTKPNYRNYADGTDK